MSTPNWHYDEMKHIGVSFDDPVVVARYDARQRSDLEADRRDASDWGIHEGHVLIEYGPGTGSFVLAAAERGAFVKAVDISAPMLSYARRQLQQAGLVDRGEFVHAGFLTYEHRGELADFVVSQFAFHHLPDFWKSIALDRIFSQLKEGGRFILRDVVFSFPPSEYSQRIQAWIDSVSSTTGNGWSRSDFEMHVRDEYSTYAWILEEMLRRTGFRIERAEQATPTQGLYVCSKPAASARAGDVPASAIADPANHRV
ncbi:MAG: class I SAM-dependent methyltransferase [Verrucomicrobiae bacterium]|nr:class I SAM-dependent methyltransferase [Verrucomicrobiae bacterium]